MIIDASLVIEAVADPGPRGAAARDALAAQPAAEPLIAPGTSHSKSCPGRGPRRTAPTIPYARPT